MARRTPLTFEQAEEIRSLWTTGQYSRKELSVKFDCLGRTICSVINREVLTGEPRKKPVPTAEAEITYRGMSPDTRVLTESGWKTAGLLTLSDKLVAVDGSYTSIECIQEESPSQLYRLSFIDNVTITTAADHRWWTLEQSTGYKLGWMLKTTARLAGLKNSHHIPTCQPVPGNKWEGKDPYVIGLMLGDGTTVPGAGCVTLYNKDEFILNYVKSELGWNRYKYEGQVERAACTKRKDSESWKDACGRSKAHFKFVPPELLTADPDTRLDVLQGLMDSDGCADIDGRMSFASVSDRLSADVRYLVRSLGGRSNSGYSDRGPTGLGGGPYYRTTVSPCGKFIPFKLPRKADRVHEMNGVNRCLVSVDPTTTGPTIAIRIAHSSHQFVVQDFIVVHDATGVPVSRKLPARRVAA